VQLTGGTTTSRDGGALRDSCGAGPMCMCGWMPPVVVQPMYTSGVWPSVLGDDY
jgi:hypothetical protein